MKKRVVCSVLVLITICIWILSKELQHSASNYKTSKGQANYSEIINKYITDKIPFQLDTGFDIESIHWLGEDSLLVILEKLDDSDGSVRELKRLYVYNIPNNTKRLLYNGEFQGDSDSNQIKKAGKGNIGLEVIDRLFVFNISSMKLVDEIKFPVDTLEVNVSSDCRSLVFKTIEGIYLSDIKNNNPKLIEKISVGSEGYPIPSSPRWA
ncbi:MAG: hypothetical protein WAX04_09430, partial [Oscillospiraceae bacterium]